MWNEEVLAFEVVNLSWAFFMIFIELVKQCLCFAKLGEKRGCNYVFNSINMKLKELNCRAVFIKLSKCIIINAISFFLLQRHRSGCQSKRVTVEAMTYCSIHNSSFIASLPIWIFVVGFVNFSHLMSCGKSNLAGTCN